jgi:DNA-binding transcriptional MerR regulator
MKRAGGRRYYRPDDVDLVRGIRHLLYGEGYTIRGVQRILRDQGTRFVQTVWQSDDAIPEAADEDAVPAAGIDAEDGLIPDSQGARRLFPWLPSRTEREAGVDLADDRREPPMEPAPTPRVEPSDRIAGPDTGLAHADVERLQSILKELSECRRQLDAALDERA